MKSFIHEVGLALRTTACYSKLCKVRQGNITLDHALLSKHWTLENVINSIGECRKLLNPKKLKVQQTIGENLMEINNNSEKNNLPTKYFDVLTADLEEDPQESSEMFEQDLERLQNEGFEMRTRLRAKPTVPLSALEKKKFLLPV